LKGIIFNLAEDVISAERGAEAWDDLLDELGLDGAYTSLGSYPDEDFLRLLDGVARLGGRSRDEVITRFGEQALPRLAAHYPAFFDGHRTTRSFLLTLNDIIHPEVRKLYPGADVPTFEYADTGDGGLALTYRSGRQLCALAEGFIAGAARHFGEAVVVAHDQCMNRGGDCCLIVCHFAAA
jgi:hypothetical protein